MKKFLSALLIFIVCLTSISLLSACNKWNDYGNGVGEYIPEPNVEYELLASENYLCFEVHHINESDFYNYVNKCKAKGFEGILETATSPDIYFMAEHEDGLKLEVFFYEDESYYYVYASRKQI